MNYETIFIVRGDLPEEQVDALGQEVKGILSEKQTVVLGEQKWGKKQLAYTIRKNTEGFYYYINFSSSESSIPEKLSTFYRHNDSVLKFLTVKLDKKK